MVVELVGAKRVYAVSLFRTMRAFIFFIIWLLCCRISLLPKARGSGMGASVRMLRNLAIIQLGR